MTKIQRLLKMHRLLAPAGEEGSDAGGTGSGGEGEGGVGETDAAKAAATAAAAALAAAEALKAGKAGTEGTPAGMSEGDAKLLKDVMKQKERATTLAAELAAATAKLQAYEGVDPVKAKALLEKEALAETAAAESRGEYDRLVKQMGERHAEQMAAATAQVDNSRTQNTTLLQQIADLTVGASFSSSQFVASDLTLTANKARVIYGSHFEYKDGKVVGYDKQSGASERTMLVNSQGDALGFDEALKVLVEADPDRDQLLRSKAKAGAGSGTNAKGAKKAVDVAAAAASSKMTPAEKISAGLKLLAKVV
jgi:hypothetical protein